jgi:uncharacterized BrkB/YihY/UPF0761 family membrane protein
MAALVTIDGEAYKKRNWIGVWLLYLVTLLVYGVVWHYKINDEARRYLRDDSIKPWLSVLAAFPGCLLVVPLFVTVYRTGQRIRRMEHRAGVTHTLQPAWGPVCALLGIVTALVLSGGCFYYYQTHLNAIWTAVAPRSASPPA